MIWARRMAGEPGETGKRKTTPNGAALALLSWACRMAGEPGEREKTILPGIGMFSGECRLRMMAVRPSGCPTGVLALNMGSIELAGLLLPILTDGNELTNSPDSGVGLFERCQPVEPATCRRVSRPARFCSGNPSAAQSALTRVRAGDPRPPFRGIRQELPKPCRIPPGKSVHRPPRCRTGAFRLQARARRGSMSSSACHSQQSARCIAVWSCGACARVN